MWPMSFMRLWKMQILKAKQSSCILKLLAKEKGLKSIFMIQGLATSKSFKPKF